MLNWLYKLLVKVSKKLLTIIILTIVFIGGLVVPWVGTITIINTISGSWDPILGIICFIIIFSSIMVTYFFLLEKIIIDPLFRKNKIFLEAIINNFHTFIRKSNHKIKTFLNTIFPYRIEFLLIIIIVLLMAIALKIFF